MREKDYYWTERFISEYGLHLPETYRENAITYNMANLYFYKKEFAKVIELLQEVAYEGDNYSLGSKSILMATYYETDEIDALYSLCDSFKAYLKRNKLISRDKKEGYKNLINLFCN